MAAGHSIELAEKKNTLGGLAGSKTEDPSEALFEGLTGEWQCFADIHCRAYERGFTGAESTLRKRLDKLTAKGAINHKFHTFHDVNGNPTRYDLKWRLKP